MDLMVQGIGGAELTFSPEPGLEEFELPAPRIGVPDALADICSSTHYDRLVHSYGKSFADVARMCMREVAAPPDVVAFPESEDDILAIFSYAADNNIAVIPFGGGTSVCGGVEADVGGSYAGTICLDMQRFNKILEVDEISRTARIQGGMLGPDIDALSSWSRARSAQVRTGHSRRDSVLLESTSRRCAFPNGLVLGGELVAASIVPCWNPARRRRRRRLPMRVGSAAS